MERRSALQQFYVPLDADHYPDLSFQVVLVHGITAPSLVFKHTAENLASGGYCVLLYGS